jgi:carbohydrate-selective porin OprB
MEQPEEIKAKMKSGQPLRGIGVFGRLGYAPDQTNPVARDASIGLYANGLLNARQNDSFGVAYYWNGTSDDLKNTFERTTLNRFHLKDEQGWRSSTTSRSRRRSG